MGVLLDTPESRFCFVFLAVLTLSDLVFSAHKHAHRQGILFLQGGKPPLFTHVYIHGFLFPQYYRYPIYLLVLRQSLLSPQSRNPHARTHAIIDYILQSIFFFPLFFVLEKKAFLCSSPISESTKTGVSIMFGGFYKTSIYIGRG